MAENPLLAAALDYAGRGWHVFPVYSPRPENGWCDCWQGEDCPSPAKHPRTEDGFAAATTDPETILKWWTWWPQANVAIRTGALSGVFVLDVDAQHRGPETLDALLRKHGPLPPTLRCATGGGGWHYYFHHPGWRVKPQRGFRVGLDIRGDDAYVVAPPSLHTSGQSYRWMP